MDPVLFPLPLVTAPMPWSTVPVPPKNTAVKAVLLPLSTAVGLASKLTIVGKGTGITVTCAVAEAPAALVAVSV
jgi:hypothetical protein